MKDILRKKVGLPPGSVIYTGNRDVEKIFIHYMQYDVAHLVEETYNNHDKTIFQPSPEDKVDWYDVRGIHDTGLVEEIGKMFSIHPLILEDISDVHQRPKFEEYEKGLFIILKALLLDNGTQEVRNEQVAIYFNKGLVISFQETESDLFLAVRRRVQNSNGRIRARGADYLAYALMDVIIDNYYLVMAHYEEKIEDLEDRIMIEQDSKDKAAIHKLRKELAAIRKFVFPLRESLARFTKTESSYVSSNTLVFIRDSYDHVIHLMDMLESFRDMLSNLHELFISEVSFRMNQVVQVLTIVSTIFIPLTFLAGIYGMNFEYIPELQWHYGYFVFWGIMIVVFVGLLFYFRRKRWL